MLRFTSCMAPNMEAMCRAVATYAAERLGVRTEYVGEIAWQERERLFDAGLIDVVWICGLPYTFKKPQEVRLLAAPVMTGSRYGGRAIYFSDIVVRRDSSYRRFADLRGSRFAYNEPRSHSGYNVVRHQLARLGLRDRFFDLAVESGSHQTSLRWILERQVDASAIDSTVLAVEGARDPQLSRHIVSIAALGPSPMPPWVARRDIDPELCDALQSMLVTLHETPDGRRILHTCQMERFVTVADSDYDSIRQMAAQAEGIHL